MKVEVRITSEGIGFRIGEAQRARLVPSPKANQTSPRRSYIYAHCDESGAFFYIGKGIARRAWDNSRHPLWHRYVERHLKGKYTVRILEDDLSPEKAEELENEWIAQEGETLVNWLNFGRKTNFDALEKYHALRDANRELISRTRVQEKSEPEIAVLAYYKAIANIEGYAKLKTEGGLVGRLLDEERQEYGYWGELDALDRRYALPNAPRTERGSSVCNREVFLGIPSRQLSSHGRANQEACCEGGAAIARGQIAVRASKGHVPIFWLRHGLYLPLGSIYAGALAGTI